MKEDKFKTKLKELMQKVTDNLKVEKAHHGMYQVCSSCGSVGVLGEKNCINGHIVVDLIKRNIAGGRVIKAVTKP